MSTSTGAPARIAVWEDDGGKGWAARGFTLDVSILSEETIYVRADEHDRIVAELVGALEELAERYRNRLVIHGCSPEGADEIVRPYRGLVALARTEEPHV